MARSFNFPPKLPSSLGALPVVLGGLGSVDPKEGAENIGLVTFDQVRKPNGILLLDSQGKLNKSDFPPELADPSIPALFGRLSVEAGKKSLFKITNYDAYTSYFLTASGGSAFREGEDITFQAGGTPGDANLTLNGKVFDITILAATPNQPEILTPLEDTEIIGFSITATSSDFLSQNSSDSHQSSDWELSSNPDFSSITASSYASGSNKLSWTPPTFTTSGRYYLRVRYRSAQGGVSAWSNSQSFTISVPVPAKPSITSPSNGATIYTQSPTFTSSAFSSSSPTETHYSSDWQVSTTSSFSNVVASATNSTANKTAWSALALSYNTTYYVRVRYRGSEGGVSAWSSTVSFTVTLAVPNKPTVSGSGSGSWYEMWDGGPTGYNYTFTINSSAFSIPGNSASHLSSDWEIAGANYYGKTGAQRTSMTVSFQSSNSSQTIAARVRHRSSNGAVSAWSDWDNITAIVTS